MSPDAASTFAQVDAGLLLALVLEMKLTAVDERARRKDLNSAIEAANATGMALVILCLLASLAATMSDKPTDAALGFGLLFGTGLSCMALILATLGKTFINRASFILGAILLTALFIFATLAFAISL